MEWKWNEMEWNEEKKREAKGREEKRKEVKWSHFLSTSFFRVFSDVIPCYLMSRDTNETILLL